MPFTSDRNREQLHPFYFTRMSAPRQGGHGVVRVIRWLRFWADILESGQNEDRQEIIEWQDLNTEQRSMSGWMRIWMR